MASTVSAITILASELGIEEDRLVENMTETYIKNAIAELTEFENGLMSKYDARTPDELKMKISEGDVHGHPAWEDYLTWLEVIDSLTKYNSIFERLLDDPSI